MLVSLALAVFADGLVGLCGGLLPESVLHRRLGLLLGFAAGALIAAFFLDLMPDAQRTLGDACWLWSMAGYVIMAVGQRMLEPHAEGHTHHHSVDPRLLLSSDALHNLGDGVALAAAFVASPRTGWAMTLAVLFHEAPHELGDYALLRGAGLTKRRALGWLVVVQLCSGVGAAMMIGLRQVAAGMASIVLALAAGAFLHIGASNLVPNLARGEPSERGQRSLGFVLGMGLIAVLSRV